MNVFWLAGVFFIGIPLVLVFLYWLCLKIINYIDRYTDVDGEDAIKLLVAVLLWGFLSFILATMVVG